MAGASIRLMAADGTVAGDVQQNQGSQRHGQGYLGSLKALSPELIAEVELNFSVDNLLNRSYYETQNYFESRVAPDVAAVWRIHGTPGYRLTAVAGITLRFGSR